MLTIRVRPVASPPRLASQARLGNRPWLADSNTHAVKAPRAKAARLGVNKPNLSAASAIKGKPIASAVPPSKMARR